MDDTVHLLVLHQFIESVKVADVHLDELIVGFVFDVLEVSQVSGIRQFVEIDDVIIRIFCDEKSNDMATYKSSATCDDDITFHIPKIFVNG